MAVFANYTGNATPAPGYVEGGWTSDPELLWSTNDYNQKGVTLEPGQGVLKLGTVLARKTSSKRYVKYDSAGSDGTNVAKGILRKSVDTGAAADSQVFLGNILYSGFLKLPYVLAANSPATTTALAALFAGAKTDDTAGYFKF